MDQHLATSVDATKHKFMTMRRNPSTDLDDSRDQVGSGDSFRSLSSNEPSCNTKGFTYSSE